MVTLKKLFFPQDGTTALFLACQNGYSQIVSMLLEEWTVERGRYITNSTYKFLLPPQNA